MFAAGLMVVSILLAGLSLLLPWFQYEHGYATSSEPRWVEHYKVYRDHLAVQTQGYPVLLTPYPEGSDIRYVMDVETLLAGIWILLGIGFVYSVPRGDAALGIFAGGLIILIGIIALYYFSSRILESAPELPQYWRTGGGTFFSGDGLDLYEDLWSWRVGSGWLALLAAFTSATLGYAVWVLFEGRSNEVSE